jgi:hypothetical protein
LARLFEMRCPILPPAPMTVTVADWLVMICSSDI